MAHPPEETWILIPSVPPPMVGLCGARSDSNLDLRFEAPNFSDPVTIGKLAAQAWPSRLAPLARRGRLPFTQGWPADLDRFADDADNADETARHGSPDASEHECLDQMKTSPTNANERLRSRHANRRFRVIAVQAGLFGVALFTVATSAVWAKRGGLEFSAPALAAIEHVGGVEKTAVPVVEATTAPAPPAPETFASPAPEFTVERIDVIDPADAEVRYFDGRAVRPVKVIWMVTTAYSPDERSCGKWADGVTASNRSVWTNGMKLVAADTKVLKMHTLISIPGYHDAEIVPVLDRGGAIKGNRLDLLYPTHERALQWGVQRLPVTVYEYAD